MFYLFFFIFSLLQSNSSRSFIGSLKKISIKCCKFYPVAYVLAKCARHSDREISQQAYRLLPEICKTPSHLFLFHFYCKQALHLNGWPRSHRKAIAAWYTENKQYREDVVHLARHITKYGRRHGISQKKMIKSSHPKPPNVKFDFVFRYVTRGLRSTNVKFSTTDSKKDMSDDCEGFIRDYNAIKSEDVQEGFLIDIIKKWRLSWEHVPATFLRSVEVWRAILLNTQMPVTAMIRNLVRMTILGLLQPGSYEENVFCTRLENSSILEQANIHPFHVLTALSAYRKGSQKSREGEDIQWDVNERVVQALLEAILKIHPVPHSNKRLLVAIDTTSEMAKNIGSSWVTIKMAAATLAFQIHCSSPRSKVVTFSTTTQDLCFQVNGSVLDIENALEEINQSTENNDVIFSVPFAHARQNQDLYDGIILLTSEIDTDNAATIRESFLEYRQQRNTQAKCVVITYRQSKHVGLEEDLNILDIEGADACAAKEIIEFISDEYADLEDSLVEIY